MKIVGLLKTKEYRDIYQNILKYTSFFNSKSIIQRIHLITNNIKKIPLCKNCGKETYYKGNGVFSEYCLLCFRKSKEYREKTKSTIRKKYGVDHVMQVSSIKKKVKETFNNKYGGHFFQSEEGKKKIKDSMINKYGVHNPSLLKDHHIKVKETSEKKYGKNKFNVSGFTKLLWRGNLYNISFGYFSNNIKSLENKEVEKLNDSNKYGFIFNFFKGVDNGKN